MSTEQVYHYIYRITNVVLNKYYYGVRSSSIHPTKDLGIKYFSSSKDKLFIKDQKDNPQNYKYKVIVICNSRERANTLEIKLHKIFNVGVNSNFYNRASSTSTKFLFNLGGINRHNAKLVNVYKAVGKDSNVLVAENVVIRQFCAQTKNTLNLSQAKLNATVHYPTTNLNINHKGYFCIPIENVNSNTLTTNRFILRDTYNIYYVSSSFEIILLGHTDNLHSFCKVAKVDVKSLVNTQCSRNKKYMCSRRFFVITLDNVHKDLPKKRKDLENSVANSNFLGNFVRCKDTEDPNFLRLIKEVLN